MARTKKEPISLASFTEKQRETLKAYKTEAIPFLSDKDAANDSYKEVVEAAAEASGVDKGLVSKFFTMAYKAEIDTKKEEIDVIDWLNS